MPNKIVYFPSVERTVSDPAVARDLFFLDQEIREMTLVVPQAPQAPVSKTRY